MTELDLTPGPPQPDVVTSAGGATSTLVLGASTTSTELDLSGGTAPTDYVSNAGTIPGALQTDVIGIPGPPGATGPQGPPGPPGTYSGAPLYVQPAPAPARPTPGLWVETNPDGSVKTMWVGTNP